MMEYGYIIRPQAQRNIRQFYYNVAKKYRHTYSLELMHKNIDDAVADMFQIEKTLLRRKPTLERWQGYHMANKDKWYYAYIIVDDAIIVLDACHAQNMKEAK